MVYSWAFHTSGFIVTVSVRMLDSDSIGHYSVFLFVPIYLKITNSFFIWFHSFEYVEKISKLMCLFYFLILCICVFIGCLNFNMLPNYHILKFQLLLIATMSSLKTIGKSRLFKDQFFNGWVKMMRKKSKGNRKKSKHIREKTI